MKKHSQSFFISVFVHFSLALLVLFLYTKVTQHSHQSKISQEHKICVNLHTLKSKKEEKKSISKKEQKRSVKKKVQPQKKVIKKIPLKKKMKKHLPKVKTKHFKPREKISKKTLHKKPPQIKKVIQTKTFVQNKTLLPSKTIVNKVSQSKSKSNSSAQRVLKTSQEKYIEENFAYIQKLIKENLYYPRRARKKGIEGRVELRFVLLKNGKVASVEILKSDYEILARAARKTIEELSGDFPSPKEELKVTLPIVYTLHK